MGKLIEKGIHDQLKPFLENYNLVISQQHGFRKSHSTQSASACARFVYDIVLNLDNGENSVAVLLDIKKPLIP